MTSAEMFQEGQILLDKVDSQALPEIQPEQFLIFLNIVVNELIQAGRIEFEQTSKIRDDISTHVKTLYIQPEILDTRIKFDFEKASLVRPTTDDVDYTKIYYLLGGHFESSYGEGINKKEGLSRYAYVQHDDIDYLLNDPHNKPKYANIVPIILEDRSILAIPPSFLSLNLFVGRFIIQPKKITQTQDCDLPEQLHHSIVKRAVELILENVESPRQQTFN